MYVNKDRPLPILEDKKDPLGGLINSFIKVERERDKLQGDPAGQLKQIADFKTRMQSKVNTFSSDLNSLILGHSEAKGALHGETKETVGLGNKDNFAMGTIDDHISGLRKDLFCNPEGLSYLVKDRVTIDPNSYLPAKAIPIASGGIFGEVPQITYHINRNDTEQSSANPVNYIGESNWEFCTPAGMFIYPMMNNSPIVGVFSDAGSEAAKTVQTPWGGTKVRYYEKGIVPRRTRPVTMTSDKLAGQGGGEMLRSAEALFERSTVHYLEGGVQKVRALNRNHLPFDVFDTEETNNKAFGGVFASRENMLYHILVDMDLGELLPIDQRPMLDYIANQVWPRSSQYPFDEKNRSRFDFIVNRDLPPIPDDPYNGPIRRFFDKALNFTYPKDPVKRHRNKFMEYIDRGLNAIWPVSRTSIYSREELELVDMVINKFWPGPRSESQVEGEIIIKLDFVIRSMLERDYPLSTKSTEGDELIYKTNKKFGQQFLVPSHGKITSKLRDTGTLGLDIKLKDIIEHDVSGYGKLIRHIDKTRCQLVSFAWRNRLEGKATVRLSIGWYTVNKSNYVHAYLDLDLHFDDNAGTVTSTVNVETSDSWNRVKQELNDNLEVVTEGLFKMYSGDVKEQPTHPAVIGGVFETQGGHMKSYNFYNRQYIGYYRHGVGSTLEFINQENNLIPTPTEYSYNIQSVINGDMFYGDHLRHIPVKVDTTNKTVLYLTQTRDWKNNYRWAFVNVESETPVVQPDGYVGPKRLSRKWVEDRKAYVPSMLIENDETSATMNIAPLVFNNWNNFTGYANYTLDENSDRHPITGVNEVQLSVEITNWIKNHVVDWKSSYKQYFLLQGNLYWIVQTLDSKEMLSDGTDCYYGVIKSCSIQTTQENIRTVIANNSIASSITVSKTNVNTKASLDIDTGSVFGFDQLAGLDVYALKVLDDARETKYEVMLNVAPFNNFYVEMRIEINKQTGEVTFKPKYDAVDPIFPYSTAIGYQIDYDSLNKYGSKIPHRVHVNYQSPVMLKKGLSSFRKTPNNYGFFTKSDGFVVINGRVQDKVQGIPLYPLGSAITIGGETLVIKQPIDLFSSDFPTNDELFVTRDSNNQFKVFGRYNNKGFNIEPSLNCVPVGFINDGKFTYHDPNSYRNSLFPVFENKRLSIGNAGQSIPAFYGKPGSKTPKNLFFKK
ncbi:hypothetical protein AVP1_0025 [Aeromonas phage AVP1]|nr:hypothetical protein AVP1_0025 [Aeromonas phage AVP1]